MQLDQYQVNAFTARHFGGNPAAVVPLKAWLPAWTMQAVAAENNLSETAFYLPEGDAFGLRWFTPTVEVDLCGHATLAAAHVLFRELDYPEPEIRFRTRGGQLRAARARGGERDGDAIAIDFPAYPVEAAALDPAITEALGGEPVAAHRSPFWIYQYRTEAEVAALDPDMRALRDAADMPVVATAPGEPGEPDEPGRCSDFVSRFFGPQVGIDEDPVTGSAHCALAPLWAAELGKQVFEARQISVRGGELRCELRNDRVILTGRSLTFLRGQIELP